MARSLTEAERQLISAMITSAKATDPNQLDSSEAWQSWRDELHGTIGRITVGEACDCGKSPSVQLLIDDQPVPPTENQIILEPFIAEGIVILFVYDGYPSYPEFERHPEDDLATPAEES